MTTIATTPIQHAAERPPAGVEQERCSDDGQQRDAEDVALHRDRVPSAATSHHRRSPPTSLPRCGERDRARQRDEVRVPDERRFISTAAAEAAMATAATIPAIGPPTDARATTRRRPPRSPQAR
jgi:hypothetical protein